VQSAKTAAIGKAQIEQDQRDIVATGQHVLQFGKRLDFVDLGIAASHRCGFAQTAAKQRMIIGNNDPEPTGNPGRSIVNGPQFPVASRQ